MERIKHCENIDNYVTMVKTYQRKVEENARENTMPNSHQGNLFRGIDI